MGIGAALLDNLYGSVTSGPSGTYMPLRTFSTLPLRTLPVPSHARVRSAPITSLVPPLPPTACGWVLIRFFPTYLLPILLPIRLISYSTTPPAAAYHVRLPYSSPTCSPPYGCAFPTYAAKTVRGRHANNVGVTGSSCRAHWRHTATTERHNCGPVYPPIRLPPSSP